MESTLTRAGLWFLLFLLAMVAAADARDTGFAAHMVIIAIVGLGMMGLTVSRYNPLRKARGWLHMPSDPTRYDDEPIRWGIIATVFWAIVGFSAGLFIAMQMAMPALNIEPWFNFGRVRPLHTSGGGFCLWR